MPQPETASQPNFGYRARFDQLNAGLRTRFSEALKALRPEVLDNGKAETSEAFNRSCKAFEEKLEAIFKTSGEQLSRHFNDPTTAEWQNGREIKALIQDTGQQEKQQLEALQQKVETELLKLRGDDAFKEKLQAIKTLITEEKEKRDQQLYAPAAAQANEKLREAKQEAHRVNCEMMKQSVLKDGKKTTISTADAYGGEFLENKQKTNATFHHLTFTFDANEQKLVQHGRSWASVLTGDLINNSEQRATLFSCFAVDKFETMVSNNRHMTLTNVKRKDAAKVQTVLNHLNEQRQKQWETECQEARAQGKPEPKQPHRVRLMLYKQEENKPRSPGTLMGEKVLEWDSHWRDPNHAASAMTFGQKFAQRLEQTSLEHEGGLLKEVTQTPTPEATAPRAAS